MKRIFRSPNLAVAAFLLLFLCGCAQYQISITPYGDLNSFRKVYLSPIKIDTLFMQGQISARLQQAGFTTVDMDLDVPAVGTQGSGFILDSAGHILTCAHLVRNHQDATVWIKGKRYPGKVIATDTNVDAGLILVEGEHNSFQPLPFVRNKEYQLGEEVYTMGFPMAEELGSSVHLTKGLVSATAGLKDDPRQIQISAQVQPGNSGGPLLDTQGEAIGMVSSTYNPLRLLVQSGNAPQDINFAIKNATLEDFLKKAKYDFPTETANPPKWTLNSAEDSIALVRAGIVEDKDVNVPALFCTFHYWVPAGDRTRLQELKLQFIDLKTFKTVLTVDAKDFSLVPGHGEMVDEMFSRICNRCFTNRPNPFKK